MKQKLISVLIIFVSGFMSLASNAQVNTVLDEVSSEINQEQIINNIYIQPDKRFSVIVDFRQVSGFIVSADHISKLFLIGHYRFKKNWALFLAQPIHRHYFLNPNSNDRGMWVQDTMLSIDRNLPFSKNNQLTVRASSSLPLSYDSRLNGILTASSIDLKWNAGLDSVLDLQTKWIKNVTFFIRPVFRYYFSLYTTTPTDRQSEGGSLLPEWLFGVPEIGISINLTDHFYFKGGYGRWIIFPYQTKYIRDKYSNYKELYQQHYYEFFLSGTWRVNKQWSVALSYRHTDRLDRDGRLETVLFDDRISTWDLSTSYVFSFDSLF